MFNVCPHSVVAYIMRHGVNNKALPVTSQCVSGQIWPSVVGLAQLVTPTDLARHKPQRGRSYNNTCMTLGNT